MCLDLLSPVSSDTAPPADAGDEEPELTAWNL